MNHPKAPPWGPETPGGTLAGQLAWQFAERIRLRQLAPGARLPSVRSCAQAQRVSPSTVVLAYDQLQALGLVEARRQRGFYVREGLDAQRPWAVSAGAVQPPNAAPRPALQPGPGPDPQPHAGAGAGAGAGADARPGAAGGARAQGSAPLAAPVDAAALIRGMFLHPAAGAAPGPGHGMLPEAWLDAALVVRALRRVLPDAADALRYGDPAGDPGLRQALSRRLRGELGIAAQPEQIITTVGATHALDLVARGLLSPGDAVLVDEPGWAVEVARLGRLGMRLLPVPRGADGPDLAVMAELAVRHRPRLYVTVSVLHNPTGHTLTLACAHQLLKLAEAQGFAIVEDDTYTWLAPAHAPRLSALDGLARTIYVSGFSKILAPNWRVGYLAAAPALAERLLDLKLLSTLTAPALHERAVAWCLDQGLMRRHAERVMDRLDAARQRVRRLAEAAGCRFMCPPAGLFGWVDAGCDTDDLAARMAAEGWLLAPGSLFHATPGAGRRLMRLNFATAQDARFWQAFERLRAAIPGGRAPETGGTAHDAG